MSQEIDESVREVVDEVRTALFEECDFVLEASRQTRFGFCNILL
jgi:predicted unusual protein kinase regulating ubiquinone biosynthesis (AarF/ABC1/UbiB family)